MKRKIFIVFVVGFVLNFMCLLAYADSVNMSVRFAKMNASGIELPDSSGEWAIVRDNVTGLYWEAKTNDESVHNKMNAYKWSGAKKKFIAELNTQEFGGFSDWRIPTSKELSSLVQKGEEPFINTDYFPNTEPSNYLSWNLCGSGEITPEKVSFGNKKIKGRKRYVRAVRGGKSS